MAACLKTSILWVNGAGYVDLGLNGVGPYSPRTRAFVLVPDTTVTDLSACEAVSLSGSDYLALKAVSAPVNTMNVTADIFVGAALVLCFALGWISGAQR